MPPAKSQDGPQATIRPRSRKMNPSKSNSTSNGNPIQFHGESNCPAPHNGPQLVCPIPKSIVTRDASASADEDSDDEIGAMIYQSSRDAKANARAEATKAAAMAATSTAMRNEALNSSRHHAPKGTTDLGEHDTNQSCTVPDQKSNVRRRAADREAHKSQAGGGNDTAP